MPSPDPFALDSPAARVDPYPAYARLRAEAPVFFSPAWQAWILSRHDDVLAAFRDPRLSSDRAGAFGGRRDPEALAKIEPLFRHLRSWALLMDPPSHTRLRGLLNKAFTPRIVEWLRPRVEDVVRELLEPTRAGDEVDVIAALAGPLPVIVIGEMLGLPRADGPRLKGWSDVLAAFLGAGQPTPALGGAAMRAVGEMEEYFRGAIASRRAAPADDLLSALVSSEERGAILGEQELLSTCSMLLFGGHETTTNLIGNGLRALLAQPAARDDLARAPEIAPTAVEELLRFDSPVQRMGRVVKEPLAIGGHTLAAGDRVFLLIGSANRDPAAFAEPDRLDLRRKDNRHLSFGFGPHYCVGAALGRLEAQSALRALLARYPRTTLAETSAPTFLDNASIRGLRALPVRLG